MKIFSPLITQRSLRSIATTCIAFSMVQVVYGAKIHLETPEEVFEYRQPYIVKVMLDTEEDTISGVGGDLSYPSNLFDIESILTSDSAVSVWATSPHVSLEKYLDGRTHILFEGIFPGGFNGVKSAYYKGSRSGMLFFLVLTPKNKGRGALVVDAITINSFSSDARELPSQIVTKEIDVPFQKAPNKKEVLLSQEVRSGTLQAFITRSSLVHNNAWYIAIKEGDTFSSIKNVFVEESNSSSVYSVLPTAWKDVTMPYILFYQDRSKYVHLKILYSDNTFAYKTIQPVENSRAMTNFSSILISILATVAICLYGYFIYQNKISKPKKV